MKQQTDYHEAWESLRANIEWARDTVHKATSILHGDKLKEAQHEIKIYGVILAEMDKAQNDCTYETDDD